MKKAINIQIEEGLLIELDDYAAELEYSRTYLIEKAVACYLDSLDEMIADRRIDLLKQGKSEVYTLEQVATQLEL